MKIEKRIEKIVKAIADETADAISDAEVTGRGVIVDYKKYVGMLLNLIKE